MRRLGRGLADFDRPTALALLYTAVALTLLEYFFLPVQAEALFVSGRPVREVSLGAGLLWVGATFVAFVVGPAVMVRLGEGRPLSAIGYLLRGTLRHAWIYLALYLVMLPVIVAVSRQPDFLATYPFVAAARHDLTVFALWEAGYLLQFFAVEAFFRGYLLFTLERRLASTAVFVMIVPYCMIHYHKPPLEAFGAIGAGLVLGALALRLRSFYGGAVLHALVAGTMDVLAVRRAGLF